MIIKYWLKLIFCNESRYIRHIYNIMLHDLTVMPEKENWAWFVKQLYESLGFNDVWFVKG